MSLVHTSPEADDDLAEIALYTATTQGSLDVARDFITLLWQEFELIADRPEIGRTREELDERAHEAPLRSFPVHTFVVYYRPVDDGIYIYRVMHSSRDLPDSF